jgi:hypothetical protein
VPLRRRGKAQRRSAAQSDAPVGAAAAMVWSVEQMPRRLRRTVSEWPSRSLPWYGALPRAIDPSQAGDEATVSAV